VKNDEMRRICVINLLIGCETLIITLITIVAIILFIECREDIMKIDPPGPIQRAGDEVSIMCIGSKTEYDIDWYVRDFHSEIYKGLCTGERVTDIFKSKYKTCNNSVAGSSWIIIQAVTLDHAGTYKCCSEDRTDKECQETRDLSVIDVKPKCLTNIDHPRKLFCNISANTKDNLVVVRCVNWNVSSTKFGKNIIAVEIQSNGFEVDTTCTICLETNTSSETVHFGIAFPNLTFLVIRTTNSIEETQTTSPEGNTNKLIIMVCIAILVSILILACVYYIIQKHKNQSRSSDIEIVELNRKTKDM
jgi:hypothetical protein